MELDIIQNNSESFRGVSEEEVVSHKALLLKRVDTQLYSKHDGCEITITLQRSPYCKSPGANNDISDGVSWL